MIDVLRDHACEQRIECRTKLRETLTDACKKIFEKGDLVSVSAVQKIPATRNTRMLREIGKQRCFPITGRSTEQHELAMWCAFFGFRLSPNENIIESRNKRFTVEYSWR